MTMHEIYAFVTGPLAWAAFLLFLGGLLGRFAYLTYLAKTKDPFVFSYMSPKYALRSIIMWSIPFVPRNARLHPIMATVTFLFHLSLLLAPIFLLAHMLLWQEGLGISFWTLPDGLADIMTVIVVIGCVFFAVRRIQVPEVRYVTTAADFILLLVVAAPFVTGFLAYHQIFPYKVMVILHILTGEIMLVAIPFTWLSHMLLAPMVRAYMGSEFGGQRHVKDW